MIELFTGTPGSGKSLNAMRRIYHYLAIGQTVISNQDIDETVVRSKKRGTFIYMDNYEFNPKELQARALAEHRRRKDGRMIEGQTLLVIDECQIIFNSRTWNAKDRMDWCVFFTQHRKYGYDIILVTQFDRLIDRQIRCLVEYEVKHRDVSRFRVFGFMVGVLFGGKLFVAVKVWNGIREKDSAQWFRLRKRYTRMYDSFRIFTDTEGGGRGSPPPGPGKADGGDEAGEAGPKPEGMGEGLADT